MARITAWRSAALAALAAGLFACKEQITATGHCPELCPTDSLIVEDTILTGIVTSDTSLRGYTRVDLSAVLLAENDAVTAYPLIVFSNLPQRWFPSGVDTSGVTRGAIDSVFFDVNVSKRDTSVKNVWLLLYRIPITTDTLATWDSVQTSFAAAPIDSVKLPDSLVAGVVHVAVNRDSLAPLASDSFRIALGLKLRSPSPTAVRLLSADLTGSPPQLKYFVHGAAPQDTFSNIFTLVPTFDTWVQNPDPAVPAPGTIVVGNQPAARSFLRFDVPSYFIDSVTLVRATLLLTLNQPVHGIAAESISVAAQPVLRYFGGKSILIQDTAAIGVGVIRAQQTGDVQIEISKILRVWRGISPDSLPRAVGLRNISEDFTTGELVADGATSGATAPRLRISFIRPFRFGVP